MGALQTRARAKKDPQEGQKRPRDTSTVCADITLETKVRRRALEQTPPSRVYLSAPHAGPRAGERERGLSTSNDHCREKFLKQVHKKISRVQLNPKKEKPRTRGPVTFENKAIKTALETKAIESFLQVKKIAIFLTCRKKIARRLHVWKAGIHHR
jgi:hypothetical protein